MIEITKATLKDIKDMQMIIANEVKEGVILPRADDEVATNIRSYHLAKLNKKLVGYCALHIHSLRMAEIRSLVVGRDYRGKSIGKELVKSALNEAKELGVDEVLVLTYLPDFFKRLNFKEIPKESIPEHKIWADCIKCIHFPTCNEVSLIYQISEDS